MEEGLPNNATRGAEWEQKTRQEMKKLAFQRSQQTPNTTTKKLEEEDEQVYEPDEVVKSEEENTLECKALKTT